MKTTDQTEGNFTPAQTSAERRCVTALNAVVQGIAIRAVIFQRGLGDHEHDVRIDGHPTPDSPVRGFATVEQAARAAKKDLGRWILEVLDRATQ